MSSKITLGIILVVATLSVTACWPVISGRTAAPADTEIVTIAASAATTPVRSLETEAMTAAMSTETPLSTQPSKHETGIDVVDSVIYAVLTEDVKEQRELLVFSSIACTTADGLGGPPKCSEGEQDGTRVEVFPILGPEGYFLRMEQLDTWEGISVDQLYAVYRVSSTVFRDEDFPAGEYAILFTTEGVSPDVTVHIQDNGIVRLDYIFGVQPDEILQREAKEIILGP